MNTTTTRAQVWLFLSFGAAALAFVGSLLALIDSNVYYYDLSSSFSFQARAQDLVNAVVVAPLLVACAVLALRGSERAFVIWLGVLTFTVYNYVIYALFIPFGSLYLLWTAVLGLSLYSLIGGVTSVDSGQAAVMFPSRRALTVSGIVLVVVSGLFAVLWLAEDLPAVINNYTPQSVYDLKVPTNPVHVLDYAFFLPAGVILGVMQLRRRAFSYPVGGAFLVFLLLTGLPILVTPFVTSSLGSEGQYWILLPIGILTAVLAGMIVWLLRSVREV
ncbi:hypothetical protein [Cryobacterium roopkundense]|nr:hypothetical protein [Cryobacterium roopkundense]MBB5639942.1 hypothetical protein [Cryobacterium roopkundense]